MYHTPAIPSPVLHVQPMIHPQLPFPAVLYPQCCDLSPAGGLMAAGLINGKVQIYQYAHDPEAAAGAGAGGAAHATLSSSLAFSYSAHPGGSCRALCFAQDGLSLFTGGEDKRLVMHDATTGEEVR